MAKKFYVASFGCRANQADSAALRQDFLDHNLTEADSCAQADVIVVNSCTVTHRADQQVRQLTRRLRRANPRAELIVTGCYAQRSPKSLTRIEGVDLVVGNTHKGDLVQLALNRSRAKVSLPARKEIAAVYRDDFRDVRTIGMSPAFQTGGKTRPFVKIQDGCDSHCSYCIIPHVRGPGRSVPADLVLKQIRELVEAGFKEVVLTGIHIGTYGMHLRPRFPLDRLLKAIISLTGLKRVRISSIEPMQLSDGIVDVAAASDKIAPHFHICLQSGSDRILGAMRRPYTTARFAHIVKRIRSALPDAAIGTDIIVGFPGETQEDHEQSVEFVESMPFTYLHVFPYSDRSGTAASRMSGKVHPRVIKERSAELRQLSDRKKREFARGFRGRRLSVLTLTEEKEGMREALSANYLKAKVDLSIPENELVAGLVVGEDRDGYQLLDTTRSSNVGGASGGDLEALSVSDSTFEG